MIQEINGKSAISGAAFISDGRFGNIQNFKDYVTNEFDVIDFEKNAIISEIDKRIYDLIDINGEIGQEAARNILIAEDFKKIKNIISSKDLVNPLKDITDSINYYIHKIHDIGIDLQDVDIFIVQEFPHPFENVIGTAVNFDKADKIKYNIDEGIYFQENRILPFATSILAAHEIIHKIASINAPYILARGLEEGLCDYLGTLFLCGEKIGVPLCLNYILNLRFGFSPTRFSERYRTSLQQAAVFYIYFGFEGLFELAREGRIKIEDSEKHLLNGDIDNIKIDKKGNWIKEITDFSIRILNFENTLVVSPLALLIAQKIHLGDNINEFFRENNINRKEGQSAIKELQDMYFVLISDGEKITSDRSKLYLDTNVMRYSLSLGD